MSDIGPSFLFYKEKVCTTINMTYSSFIGKCKIPLQANRPGVIKQMQLKNATA